jgi:hypothetical protein
MFGFGDKGLRRQKAHFERVRDRLVDLESRSDVTELRKLWADVWQDHAEEQEFRTKLAQSRQLIDLSAQQLRLARSEIPRFDQDLHLIEGALNDCQRYIENLLTTLMTRQALLKSDRSNARDQ